MGDGLEREQGEAEGGCGGVEAAVVRIGGFFSAVSEALEKKYGGEEREKGEKGPENDEVDVHGRPFAAGGSQAWIGASIWLRRCFLIAGRSGLRGRRTLEEGGPNVVVRCNNVVLTWLVNARFFDQGGEEEKRDEEEEGGDVIVRCVGDQKEQHGDESCEESESFTSADF